MAFADEPYAERYGKEAAATRFVKRGFHVGWDPPTMS
jgi:hypothetical protein